MKMKTIEVLPGEHIAWVAARAVETVANDECEVSFDFNEIALIARRDMSEADVVAEYNRLSEERRAVYVASPEYKARLRAAEEEGRRREAVLAAVLARAPKEMTVRDAGALEGVAR